MLICQLWVFHAENSPHVFAICIIMHLKSNGNLTMLFQIKYNLDNIE